MLCYLFTVQLFLWYHYEVREARLHVTFRRWRGICLAMEYSANFTRTMVISKRNRHHQNHSKQPGKHRKQDKICLSGAYTRCSYCVKSELFCPRCLNEKLFAAPLRASNVCDDGSFSSPKECASALSQPRDVACDSWAKGCYDWFCRCRGFSFFWPSKEHKRKTWRKIQVNN